MGRVLFYHSEHGHVQRGRNRRWLDHPTNHADLLEVPHQGIDRKYQVRDYVQRFCQVYYDAARKAAKKALLSCCRLQCNISNDWDHNRGRPTWLEVGANNIPSSDYLNRTGSPDHLSLLELLRQSSADEQ